MGYFILRTLNWHVFLFSCRSGLCPAEGRQEEGALVLPPICNGPFPKLLFTSSVMKALFYHAVGIGRTRPFGLAWDDQLQNAIWFGMKYNNLIWPHLFWPGRPIKNIICFGLVLNQMRPNDIWFYLVPNEH